MITPQGQPIYFPKAQGNDFEIGKQIGQTTSSDIARMWETWMAPGLAAQFATPQNKFKPTYAWLRNNLESICPWLCEQIDGIALGSGLEREKVWLMNHYAVLWSAAGVFCTSVTFQDSEEGPLLAQNLELGSEDFYYAKQIKPSTGLAVLSEAMGGMAWSPTGINEAGLAVGSSNLTNRACKIRKPLPGGVPCHFIPSMILRQCETVAQAIEFVKSLPDICPLSAGYQMNLIDAQGHTVIIDKSGDHTLIHRQDQPINVTSNASLDCDFEQWRTHGTKTIGDKDAYSRAHQVLAWHKQLNGRFASIDQARQLLRSRGGAGFLCRDGKDLGDGYQPYTRLSMIYLPHELQMYITNGVPDRCDYELFQLSKLITVPS